MKRLYGNTVGLKPNQIRKLENLYRRRTPPPDVITHDIVRDIARLSSELRRQIGLLINRKGKIAYVVVGDNQGIVIPSTASYRAAPGRLKGLRCVHTHLNNEGLTQDDMADLALLRLDMMAAVTINAEGLPNQVHVAHLLPQSEHMDPFRTLDPLLPHQLSIGCLALIHALESEMAHVRPSIKAGTKIERAMLISVTTGTKRQAKEGLDELKDLADSSGIEVVDQIIQQRQRLDARFVLGRGRLRELVISALQKGVTLIVFDQELNPSQIRSITNQIELKVIDRTQLILDIFAQRARSREGKLQVELAQLKYLLPRLVVKNTAMSRLTGGIGGRGPGETKLEINRRRVRDRIRGLEKSLQHVRRQRKQQKAKRSKKGLPVISIIGYTNAGKSTLLNILTDSKVLAENRLFATLDPSSRRMRFPKDFEVIITDTVGFIKNLPKDLMVAFRATLEELEGADLLLHVIDLSNPRFAGHIRSVDQIIADLNLQHIDQIRVFNKKDKVSRDVILNVCRLYDGIAISANVRSTLPPLIKRMEHLLHPTG
jgi:GTP-binding protein HflX